MSESKHIPVMLQEAIEGLNIKNDGIYVDCTMGGAGHASEILSKLSRKGHLYCIEQDVYAINKGNEKLSTISNNYTIVKDNFVNIKFILQNNNIDKVDGILYDLGVSSFQFDQAERGFSYNKDARLDMRMNQEQELTAYDIVNTYSFEELRKIFYEYGEERFSGNIAKEIIIERNKKNIETTFELVDVIKKAIPAFAKRKSGHPAKKVFQALRIAVNDELNVFEKSLRDALTMLKPGGRIVVITFHSLEDRICKNIFRESVTDKTLKDLPIRDCDIVKEFKLINNKVITASDEELENNNRAHSAKLRIIEKL